MVLDCAMVCNCFWTVNKLYFGLPLNTVVQRESEDVVLHEKAVADWLQDKCLDVRVRLILVSLPNYLIISYSYHS